MCFKLTITIFVQSKELVVSAFTLYTIFHDLSFPATNQRFIIMDTKQNELYEAPAFTIVEVKQEGVICASGDVPGMPGYPGGGDPFNP